MNRICVFAGTTEGRKLAEFLSLQPVKAIICVATEYGEELIPEAGNLEIRAGRMTEEEMVRFFQSVQPDLVIDATHPYAAQVSANISSACSVCNVRYQRLLRGESGMEEGAVYVPDVPAAAAFLDGTEGNILLTTGSKELSKYQNIRGFSERVYARVLPMESSLLSCKDAGLKPAHILAMQGPFSEEMNVAMLKTIRAEWMVTKDGGDAGGFQEKLSAAQQAGARLVVIGRPQQGNGCSYSDLIQMLCQTYGCQAQPEVSIVGIGPGSRGQMTEDVIHILQQAECVIGAKRMLEATVRKGQDSFAAIAPEQISQFVFDHPEYTRFAVVMSGDTGFFSGTRKLIPLLSKARVQVYPGISSFSYLCAKLGQAYDDVHLVSLHGREHDIVADVRRYPRIFALVGGADGINVLCRDLAEAGLGQVQVSIGERLSYPEEKITTGTAEELQHGAYDPLCAALLENEQLAEESRTLDLGTTQDMKSECAPFKMGSIVTPGLPDTAFTRGGSEEGVVPMTKSEIRAISLSKLQLTKDAVCWDVGAGTGSVSIEMARTASNGQVYAIEKKAAAVSLLKQNTSDFGVSNLTVLEGTAPEALRDLPAPTHVFIGGSSGNMEEILQIILQKNPKARIVATAIALESVSEITRCLKELPVSASEVVSVTIARDRKAGSYHLMTGQNPIYIFTLQF